MRTFDPSQMTRTERQKIGKRASRNVGSEVTLILTAGFAALMIVLFWFVNLSFLPLAKMFGISPTLDWIGLAVTISFAFGIVHGWFASSVVAQELLSNLVFEGFGSCGDLVWVCGFNSVFERDACDDFGKVVKAA